MLVIVLLGIGGYFAYQTGKKAVAEIDPVGRQFIQRIYAGDTESAWGMVSDEWMRTSNREDFRKWTDSVRKQFNGSPNMTQEGFRFYRGTGGSIETLTYRLTRGSTVAVMTLHFTRRNARVLISAATFSPSSSSPR